MLISPSHVKTGIIKFGQDWSGVFIRGNDSSAYSAALQRALIDDKSLWVIDQLILGGLLSLLSSSIENPSTEAEGLQKLKEFTKCLQSHQEQSG